MLLQIGNNKLIIEKGKPKKRIKEEMYNLNKPREIFHLNGN